MIINVYQRTKYVIIKHTLDQSNNLTSTFTIKRFRNVEQNTFRIIIIIVKEKVYQSDETNQKNQNDDIDRKNKSHI